MRYKLAVIASLAAFMLSCNTSSQNQNHGPEVTAMDQSDNANDQVVTRKIRQAVVADKDLSVTAANIQIITRNGVVTLMGMVRSAAEKDRVEKIADRLKGDNRLENKLQINK